MRYEKPVLVALNAPGASGDCASGSGDIDTCDGAGNTAGANCDSDGNDADICCASTGNTQGGC
ncbi:MAG: glycoside hydrolase family 32 protein [Desulfobacterales bacterium]|nr:glycoside hydrolase family 32 protein [Desulfobacterales bacterium]